MFDKIRTELTHYIDYNDFENLVKEVYNRQYSLAADEEMSNDSSFTSTIKKELLDEWDSNYLEKFKNNEKAQYLGHILLQDLVNNNYLPEGNFVIEISW